MIYFKTIYSRTHDHDLVLTAETLLKDSTHDSHEVHNPALIFPFLQQDDGLDGDAGAELEPADPADRAGPPLPAARHRLLPGRLFN